MRFCNIAMLAAFLAVAELAPAAQQAPAPSAPAPAPAAAGQAPSLTVDRDPVRSPDGEPAPPPAAQMRKQGEGLVLHTDVEEVVLNCTVLDGNNLVPNLKKENFQVYEDGVQADPHQLPAHRPSGFHRAGGGQLRVHDAASVPR